MSSARAQPPEFQRASSWQAPNGLERSMVVRATTTLTKRKRKRTMGRSSSIRDSACRSQCRMGAGVALGVRFCMPKYCPWTRGGVSRRYACDYHRDEKIVYLHISKALSIRNNIRFMIPRLGKFCIGTLYLTVLVNRFVQP